VTPCFRLWVVCEASGLDDQVIPHTLRHMAITWYLRSGKNPHQVSDYCGVSMQIINKHYKHHLPGALTTSWRRRQGSAAPDRTRVRYQIAIRNPGI
jgi:integrase